MRSMRLWMILAVVVVGIVGCEAEPVFSVKRTAPSGLAFVGWGSISLEGVASGTVKNYGSTTAHGVRVQVRDNCPLGSGATSWSSTNPSDIPPDGTATFAVQISCTTVWPSVLAVQ
jgi:hypothetical protein